MKNTPKLTQPPAGQSLQVQKLTQSYAPARALTLSDLNAVAKLCGEKYLNTSQACRVLGIEPKRFFDWCSRSSRDERFKAAIETFKSRKLASLVEQIDKAAYGKDGVKMEWRAAQALAAAAEPKVWSDSGQRAQITVSANVNYNPSLHVLVDIPAAMRAYRQCQLADAAKRAQVIDVQPAKPSHELADAKPEPDREEPDKP